MIGHAVEVRKQQFAATSLVMDLVPLILKNTSSPERSLTPVPEPLIVVVEVRVRAWGISPVDKPDTKRAHLSERLSRRNFGGGTLLVLILSLIISYGALVAMESFSKMSSLGCPYPLFVCTWFIIALIPAGIRTYISQSLKSVSCFVLKKAF